MTTTVVVALITAVATIAAAVIYNITAIRSARRQVETVADERAAEIRAEDTAAQVAANAAMAKVSEQMATTTYAYIDRMRAEFVDLMHKRAAEQLAYERTINELQERVALLDNEVRVLRQMTSTDGSHGS